MFAGSSHLARSTTRPRSSPASRRFTSRPGGENQPSGVALRFALEYAIFFREKLNQQPQALDLLADVLGQIDLEKPPVLGDGAAWAYISAAYTPYPGISRGEFIRVAYGVFAEAGEAARFVEVPAAQMREGKLSARRTLARIRTHQGETDEALRLELEFIEVAKFDEPAASYRRAMAYQAAGRAALSAEQFERCLTLPFAAPKLRARGR